MVSSVQPSQLLLALLAFLGPPIVNLPGLLIAEGLHPVLPYVTFGTAMCVGVVAIWKLMGFAPAIWRVAVTVLYIPFMAGILILGSLIVVGLLYERFL